MVPKSNSKPNLRGKGAGHWQIPISFEPDDYYGFIYEIECTATGQRYIGKKAFHRWNKTGSKRIATSNWRVYAGSSQYLKDLIGVHGYPHFKFRILILCCTKSCLSYSEANIIHKLDVMTKLLPNGERMYLNKIVPEVAWIPKDCNAIRKIRLIREIRDKKEAGQEAGAGPRTGCSSAW